MIFRLQRLRFTLTATCSSTFPRLASNTLRGDIGRLLRARKDDTYWRFFDPEQTTGPSGLSDPPRPFVLRAAHLDGLYVPDGGSFHFDMNLFDLRTPWAEVLAETLEAAEMSSSLHTVDLEPAEEVSTVRVRFLTPTELKTQGGLAEKPDFGVLAARIRDRISTLNQLYGDGPLDIDFAAFGQRAEQVRMTRCEIQHVEAQRRSGSTGQTHSLGGFIGEADYEGDLTEFIPYLRAAQWTGVGRQTTWGKGAIALQE